MRKMIITTIMLLLTFLVVGCSAYDSKEGDSYDSREHPSAVPSEGGPYEPSEEPSIEDKEGPQAGQITASEWRDLANYDFYLSLFENDQDQNPGIFRPYSNDGYFNTLNRIKVTVKNKEDVISGANVSLYNDSGDVIYSSISNVLGVSFLFPKTDELENIASITVDHDGESVTKPYSYNLKNTDVIIDIDSENNHQDEIEIMFVIDTTGSMGDELEYLKSEIKYVITETKTLHSNSTIKLALLFYRDNGDDYVTRYFDFTTDIDLQKQNISKQSASGGGDYPEAVDIALAEAVSKNWSSGNTTKLLFHVLDAPPHNNQEAMTKYYNAIYKASIKGIRMIPIASSGIDKYTEFLLRNEAMMSGGTYVYITNDSGIGNDHIEASVGEVVVEYLNKLMVRLINEYHTGIPGEKIPYYKQ